MSFKWMRKKSDTSPIVDSAAEVPPVLPDFDKLHSETMGNFRSLANQIDEISNTVSWLRYDMDSLLERFGETFEASETADTPDEEYAQYLRFFVSDEKVANVRGEILEVRVIGKLQDDSFAWVNEEFKVCGVISREQLGEMKPFPDDHLRARIVSYQWGHVVENVVPNSLRSQFQTRTQVSPSLDWGRELINSYIRFGSEWLRGLRPGDVVLARIPYDGPMPVDRRGRRGKERPSVFMRWEDDYAILRACYDVKSFVGERELGHRILDSECFTKSSVVRYAEYDTKIENLLQRKGRLGPRDLMALHIPDTPEISQKPVVIKSQPARELSDRVESTSTVDATAPISDIKQIVDQVAATAGFRSKSQGLEDKIRVMLQVMLDNEKCRAVMLSEGVKFAVAGEILHRIAQQDNIVIAPGTFGKHLTELIGRGGHHAKLRIYIAEDEHGLGLLKAEYV